MTSSSVMFCRYETACGLAASPMMRICSLLGPLKLLTMTVTTGSRMNFDNAFSSSRASSAGFLPSAGTSSTSGVLMRPSGRTGQTSTTRDCADDDIDDVEGPMTYL